MPRLGLAVLGVVLGTAICLSNPALARVLVVNCGSPRASDFGPGTETLPLETINAAAQLANPGDTVLVHAGVYRETVIPARGGQVGQPIVYQAAPGEAVAVRGSMVWNPAWQTMAGQTGIYEAVLPPLPDYNPFAVPALALQGGHTLGQLFLNGVPLTEADGDQPLTGEPLTWRAMETGTKIQIYAPAGPPAELEISVRASLFRSVQRGLGYITVRGFVFEQCANQAADKFWMDGAAPQAGEVSTRSGHNWTIEDNVIRFAKGIGLDCGSEGLGRPLDGQPTPADVGHHEITGNTICDNGQIGLAGSGQIGTRIAGNTFLRNDCLHYQAVEEAALKCHRFLNGLIENNLFQDNEAPGIWLDNVWQNTRIRHNVFIGNRGAGIFMEMGRGPCWIKNNVLARSRPGLGPMSAGGDGLYAHDASGLDIEHNLMSSNAEFGIYFRTVSGRTYPVLPADIDSLWQAPLRRETVSTSDETILNNLVLWNRKGGISLRFGEGATGNVCDSNLYSGSAAVPASFFVNGAAKNADGTPRPTGPLPVDRWRQLTGYDVNSLVAPANLDWTIGDRIELTLNWAGTVPASGPGPFPDLVTGSHHWVLWPVPPAPQ